ncbi:MAG: Ig-like domain-containing protein, partial [Myxococcales bacterium]|nr:Ig-like domain-containing protein [Myxococcales bacterium]
MRPGITLHLPAIAGDANLTRKVTLEIDSGGAKEAVVKSGGAPVTLADLGTSITVDAPATVAADDKTFTYTLTVSNQPSSAASVTATGTLAVIPAPVLSGTLTISPPSILGGLAPTLSVTLPALNSAAASAATVSFSISGCGSGEVTKSGGGPVTLSDLVKTITIASPPTVPADQKTCTYTLTVSNAAATPASAVATAPLSVGTGAGAIVKLSGDGQFGKAGTALDGQFVVQVTDVHGAALPNFPVTWAVASGGGSLSGTTSLTDASGLAVTTLTLGASAVVNTVTLSASGFANLTFTAIAAGGVAKFSGDLQFGKTGAALANQFVVKVTDFSGAPISGFPVVWAVTAGGGSLSGTTSTTDALGLAVTTLTAGASAIANTVTATSPGFTAVTFSATAAGAVTKFSGDAQFGKTGSALDNAFVVRVTDFNGAALAGFPVAWAVTAGGGSLAGTTSTTDASGFATTTLTPGASAITNSVTATATGFSALTFNATAAGDVVKLGGDAQFGKTGTALANQFVVKVTDFSGAPLSGFPVAWAVATGGGTLSGTTSATDASGLAVTTLTPGASAISNSVTATATGFTALTFTATAAASAVKLTGDPQFGKTGTALANPFVVKVTDFSGAPLAGFPVAWAVTVGGGSLSGTISTTDVNGLASTTLTPGASAISNSVTATATGFTALIFTATAAAAAVQFGGDGQFGKAGTALANQFVVKVTDFNGAALSGFPVTWAVTAGGGSLAGTTSVTDGSGVAVTTLTLGASAIANTVTATLPGFAVLTFSATAAGAVAKFSVDPQFGKTGTALANPFVVKVTDFSGAALAGFPVVWAVTAGGGSLSGTTSTTDVNGLASTTLTAGASAVSNSVTATATGFTAVIFTATAAAAVVKISGDLQSGKSGTALANPFVVKATDFSGANLSGFPVAWAVTAGGGSVSSTSTSTGAGGTAQTTLTLGAAGGANSATATATGFSALTFTAAGANAIALNDGDTQTGTSGQPLATPLSVLVTDASATPVSGVTVTWAATAGGGSIPLTSVTDGSGIASAIATLGPGAGSNTFTAAITGLTAVPFTATAVLPPSFTGSTTSTPNLFVAGTGPTLTVGLPTITNFTAGTVHLKSCYPDLNTCTDLGVSSATLQANFGGSVPVTAPSLPSSTAFRTLQFVVSAQNSAGFTASGTPASVFVFPAPQGLNARRIGATATQLDSVGGHAPKVVIAGGGTALTAGTGASNGTCSGAVATAELYDPETGIATAISPALTQNRCMHTAVKVGTKVYFLGGADTLDIDVYDENAGTFATSSLPQMAVKRTRHASLIGFTSTKIISIGGAGVGGSTPGQTIEVLDTTATPPQIAATYKFSNTNNTSVLSTARIDLTATLMRSSIMIIGGES